VVDDGSHDGTAEAAKAAGAIVINHEARRGAGAATRTGFQAANQGNADILVTLDGDGQHNPDELPQVLEPILNGEADLVIGSRFLQPTKSTQQTQQTLSTQQTNIPRYRKFGIKVITWLYNLGSKTKVSDSQSCFRAHNRKLIDAVNITEDGFGFSVQVLIQARQKAFIMKEVPISCSYHSEGSTMNPVRHGLGVAFTVVKLRLKGLR
jgi:glycosyltransferase involved in cell wall biosynthesis